MIAVFVGNNDGAEGARIFAGRLHAAESFAAGKAGIH